jgi:hypothetical protein
MRPSKYLERNRVSIRTDFALVRDPEKWEPFFGKSWSGMMTRLKIIPL